MLEIKVDKLNVNAAFEGSYEEIMTSLTLAVDAVIEELSNKTNRAEQELLENLNGGLKLIKLAKKENNC